ncbi:MAG: hypothetical protein IKP88_08205 [Lachnospiraceae bacterium]|nr:hypothetical protein [Lachnospiraceae bacterium]
MKYEGIWKLVAAQGIDYSTFERIWITNEDLGKASNENPLKMMYNAVVEFTADGITKILCDMTERVKGASEADIKEFLESGEGVKIGDTIMMVQKFPWKEEDGVVLVDSGERGEVLGEAINPYKPVVEFGNTIILNESYQLVRDGETPSEIKKTVKEVKEGTSEMKEAAGTYIGQYTKFVGDGPDSKDTSKQFKIVLNDDGTGMSYRDDLEIKIPDWTVENGDVKLTEKFLGKIDYTGKLDGKNLNLFNGEPSNPFTCEYVFVKE